MTAIFSISHYLHLLGTRKHAFPTYNSAFIVIYVCVYFLFQRKAYTVLVPFLPTKFEYVLNLSLTEVQIKLYHYYLENFARNKSGSGNDFF